MNISNKIIEYFIETIKSEIENNKDIENKEVIKIANICLYQAEIKNSYKYNNENNSNNDHEVIITQNNYEENDYDFYYVNIS